MEAFLIFISLTTFSLGSYFIWFSRYNVLAHLSIGFCFIAYFVPAVILDTPKYFDPKTVSTYVNLLIVGALFYIIGLFIGFNGKIKKTRLSFDTLPEYEYEKRAIKITKTLLSVGIVLLSLSYLLMGFIPMFAADPISAKFFRGVYQAPYQRVAILFRSSFYILSTIIPICVLISYKNRDKFIITGTILAIVLMMVSLSRGPAFTGFLLGVSIIMSFKSAFHFKLLIILMFVIYAFSSIFYFLIGVKTFEDTAIVSTNSYWELISGGSPDIAEQIWFVEKFFEQPIWTSGKTIFGGLVPGHYKWNPSVYTLNVIAPDVDVNDIGSGGLRLPVPIWGFVSFKWPGVILFCILSGFLQGKFTRYNKIWIERHTSLITRSIVIVVTGTVFGTLINFYLLSIYALPPLFILLFYIYRFRFSK